jgi:hypothetical protein
VLRCFGRNLALTEAVGGVLLGVFAASSHRVHVLPGDASPLGVLLGAVVLAAGVTLVEWRVRHP